MKIDNIFSNTTASGNTIDVDEPIDERINAEPEPESVDQILRLVVAFCKKNHIEDPVEILRKLQNEMVCGRGLEIEDTSVALEGDTNFIIVDRYDIMRTAFDEIKNVDNFRLTLEVQFYNEVGTIYFLFHPYKQ